MELLTHWWCKELMEEEEEQEIHVEKNAARLHISSNQRQAHPPLSLCLSPSLRRFFLRLLLSWRRSASRETGVRATS